jgi:tetratricopeptide (TPR) repeat protein
MIPLGDRRHARVSPLRQCAMAAPCVLALGIVAAQQQIKPAAEPAPATRISVEERGDIYMARKMYREAADVYLTAPPAPRIWNKIGIAYQQQNDLAAAKRYYDRAVKGEPGFAEALNNIGTVYYARKNYRKAVSYYKKALVSRPDAASILANLGTAYFARHKYQEAIVEYQKALQIDPSVFENRRGAGPLLEERDIQERAKFSYYMALLCARQGLTDKALQYIRKALESGFKDKKKFTEGEDFASIRKLPEFEELMKLEPRVL